jgi:hypothetical protein
MAVTMKGVLLWDVKKRSLVELAEISEERSVHKKKGKLGKQAEAYPVYCSILKVAVIHIFKRGSQHNNNTSIQ